MPYINAKINKPASGEATEKFKADMGKAIEVFPGKSEYWLMVGFEEGKLWMRGSDEPAAMVEVSVLGGLTSSSCSQMTGLICESMEKNFGISPDRVYVKYQPIDEWGWNGSNF